MTKLSSSFWGFGITLALALTGCGKAEPTAANAADETCSGAACTEASINAPVGPQPAPEAEVVYDLKAGNPRREGLRFPDFDASWELKREIFDKAQQYFESNKERIANPRYFMVVDFSQHSSKRRLYVFDLSDSSVARHNVAAGKNSDPDGDGYATNFSNQEGSLASSLGFYRTLSTYNGGHGLSLRLEGLDDTNNNAYARAVVMHPATYVKDGVSSGRSWGCPAIDPRIAMGLIGKVKNGSMLLIDR